MKKKITKAVFPVAGLGTRFLPATKVLPKEMLPLFNKPIIQYAVEEAMDAGIEELIFVTGRGKVLIEDHFDISYELDDHLEKRNKFDFKKLLAKGIPGPGKAFFTRQQHPYGLGHAIYCAKSLIGNEPFAVLLPDEYLTSNIPCLKNMLSIYNQTKEDSNIIAVQQVPIENISSYGVVKPKNSDSLETSDKSYFSISNLIEKPSKNQAPSDFAVIGRYILQPSIFDYLENSDIGIGGEIQLTDSIDKSIEKHNTYAYIFNGKRFDCGNPLGLFAASLDVALKTDYKNEILKLIQEEIN